jgi:hypothetical protein
MDQTQLQQKIGLYYSKLAPDAQKVFSSLEWVEVLRNISIKYGLNKDQIETLGTETTLALLGIIHLGEYEKILSSKITIEKRLQDAMLDQINKEIFNPINTHLYDAFDSNVDTLAEERYGKAEKVDERFSKLPKEIQDAISDSDYQPKLYAISEKYKLSIEQMGSLEEITTKVMLGIIHPDAYENELQSKINMSKDVIAGIVQEVNEKILKNIRALLMAQPQDAPLSSSYSQPAREAPLSQSTTFVPQIAVKQDRATENKIDEDAVPLPPYAKAPELMKRPAQEAQAPTSYVQPPEKKVTIEPIKDVTINNKPADETASGIYATAGIEIVENEERSPASLHNRDPYHEPIE